MGDRASVSFKYKGEESVVLFNHWGGKEFQDEAVEYAKALKSERSNGSGMRPIDRFEPCVVMVDFIRHITHKLGDKRMEDTIYLGATENDGDNGDNGHVVVDFNEL